MKTIINPKFFTGQRVYIIDYDGNKGKWFVANNKKTSKIRRLKIEGYKNIVTYEYELCYNPYFFINEKYCFKTLKEVEQEVKKRNKGE